MAANLDKRYSWRAAGSILLLVIGCLLLLLSVVAIWVNNLVLDSDRFTETVAPLSKDPAIDNALADRITDELFTAVDVEDRLHDAFPQQIAFLAGPLTDRLHGYTRDATYDTLQSDGFNELWVVANRKAHEAIVSLLTGEGDVLKSDEGKVVLDLEPVLQEVLDKLGDAGHAVFGRVDSSGRDLRFVIFESQTLADIQGSVDLLQKLSVALPLLCLLAFGVSLLISVNRRRSLVLIGIGASLSMVVLIVALAVLRTVYLNSVASAELSTDAAAVLFDTLIRFLRGGIRTVFMVSLLLAAGAWLAGPASLAARIRVTCKRGFRGLGSRLETAGRDLGPAGEWLAGNRRALQVGGMAIALLLLIWWDWPDRSTLVWIAIILAVYLLVIEFLGRAGTTEPEDRTAG